MAVKEAGAVRASARERLLAAANELFYNEGVHTVGIDRIIEQAGVVSLLYVVSYLGLAVPVVLAGFGVVYGGGLTSTARYYGAAVIALAALALIGLLKTRPGRAAAPAACPAQGIL